MIKLVFAKFIQMIKKILSTPAYLSLTYWAMSAVIAIGIFSAMTIYFVQHESEQKSDFIENEIHKESRTYRNGQIEYEYYLKNGLKEGREIWYKPDGAVEWICHYKNGLKEGKEIVYFKDRDIVHYEVEYKNGKKDGIELLYHEDGIIKSKATYVNNVLEGEYLQYDVRGKAMLRAIYQNNTKMGNAISIH